MRLMTDEKIEILEKAEKLEVGMNKGQFCSVS